MDYCTTIWSGLLDWKEDIIDPKLDWMTDQWNYYRNERAALQISPLAVSILSAASAAYLFQYAKPLTGAVFGAVNYVVLTSLIEIIRTQENLDGQERCALVAIAGAITWGFLETVCKTHVAYQAAAVLTLAAFAGQFARGLFAKESDPY